MTTRAATAMLPPQGAASRKGMGTTRRGADAGWRWIPALWSIPLVLALLFALVVALWAQHNDAAERAEQADAIKTDALSLEAQLRGRLETEDALLRAVAARLAGNAADGDTALATTPEVAAGLGRLWRSLVWLDSSNRVVGQIRRAEGPGSEDRSAVSSTDRRCTW